MPRCTRLLRAVLLGSFAALAACNSTPEDAGATNDPVTTAPTPEGARRGAAAQPSNGVRTRDGSTIVVDLGAVPVGQPITLEIPDNALGFNVVVTSEGSGRVGVERIEAPSGVPLVEAFIPKHGLDPIGLGYRGVASLSVPQNDLPEALAVPAGAWKLFVAGEGTNPRVRVRIQTTDDGNFHGGALDLRVHLPTGLRLPGGATVSSAEVAASDPAITERIRLFFEMLDATLGIARGTVSFHAADARFVTADDHATVDELAIAVTKESKATSGVDLVLTNHLLEGDVFGYAPGMPGAASTSGTRLSVIVGALYESDRTPELDAFTWLHELGHFVGLAHTSEKTGTRFDFLDDTGQCTLDRTTGNGGACPDDGNLMGTGPNEGATLVTPAQKAVFLGSPIYRAFTKSEAEARAAGL
jgi:hypothetical protein